MLDKLYNTYEWMFYVDRAYALYILFPALNLSVNPLLYFPVRFIGWAMRGSYRCVFLDILK